MVSEINVAEQLRLLEVRRELERLIARSAARAPPRRSARASASIADGFEKAAKANDDVAFMRIDREFNACWSAAAHNEFAAGAMGLMHALSRRFWYIHYKQAADMPQTAKLHADIARAIAKGKPERARRPATGCSTTSRNSPAQRWGGGASGAGRRQGAWSRRIAIYRPDDPR